MKKRIPSPKPHKNSVRSFRPDADVLKMLIKMPTHFNKSAIINACLREKLPEKVFRTK